MYDQSIFAGMMMFLFIFIIASYLYFGYAQYRIAKKVGHRQPWWAFVPILQAFQLIRMAGKEWYWFLFGLVPFVQIVIFAILWMQVAKACHKDPVWGILMILPVVNFVSIGVIAFGQEPGTSPFPPHDHTPRKPAGVV